MPVISMLILVPCSAQPYRLLDISPVNFEDVVYGWMSVGLQALAVAAKFIDLSVCTGHLMLGFFEPTYRQDAGGP